MPPRINCIVILLQSTFNHALSYHKIKWNENKNIDNFPQM